MMDELDKTMPGYRDRKTDGRFATGDLILGRYKVLAELGKGGMGIVYKCEDQTSHVCYAVKTLAPELTDSKWEMEEILYNFQLVQKLHHPNIANYNALELDPQTNRYFLVMEYVEGEDLRYWLRSKRREGADLQQVIPPVVRQIAQALDYAHSQKIVHRDIKPGNIMIDGMGNVKVLDFGLAAQIHSSLSRVSIQSVNEASTCGTIPYMAPEQWRGGEAEAASDQYALAATVYEMFSGRPPFDSADKDILRNCTLHEAPRPLKDVSPAIRSAVEKALAKEPEDRFKSCADFAAAMGGAKVAKSKEKSPEKERGKSGGGAWKWIAAMNVLVLLAGGAFGGWYFAAEQKAAEAEARAKAEAEARAKAEAEAEEPLRTGVVTLPGGVPLKMIRVEPGSFMMGSENGDDAEKPVHWVTLTQAYYLGETEVTQAQWRAVMGNNPSRFQGDNRPVEQVNWNDAMAFCRKLNDQGRAPKGWKFTLPTEAQWEFAARGGNRSRGYTYSGSNNVGDVAWYYVNSGKETHAVRRKQANELGLYDMSGNVKEWCLDWYGSGSYSSGAVTDPQGPYGGSGRVQRGGSWINGDAQRCRSASRYYSSPVFCDDYYGFRLALVPVR